MAQIESGDGSGNKLSVNAAGAGFATLYDSSGNELIKKPSRGSYVANVLLRQSAATAANTIVWSLFNASATVRCYIRSIRLQMLFDGTAAAGTSRAYYLQRIATAAPSAGTAITPAEKRSADAASIADVRFLDTGLTVGAMTVVGTAGTDSFARICLPISVTGVVQYFPIPLHIMAERLIAPIELVQNEGIGIFLNEATTIGVGLCGAVEWDEHTP